MDQAPNTTPLPPMPQESSQSGSTGPIIGAVIVILVLALGALYFWGARLNERTPDELPFIPGDETSESWMPATSNSDDAAAIEAELEATNMTEFEQRMNADLEATESGL